MDVGVVWGGVVLATIVGTMVTRWLRDPDRRIKSLLRGLRPTPIANIPDGKVVKIVGELVYAGRSLEAPLSKRACACYSLVVEEYRSSGRSGAWHEIVREVRGIDFYLRDATGMALVRVSEPHSFPSLVQDHKSRLSPLIHADADLERFLVDRGRSTEGLLFRKNFRGGEGVLEQGERVAVAGLARWLPDPNAAGGSYRETPKRLVIESSEEMAVFISDDPDAL